MLRLWLCGRFAGEIDGEPLSMPTGDRVRALIGWLALHPGPHPRSDLAARLWPDAPGVSARASLRTAIWSVRQSWGQAAEQVLDSSRNSIGLRGDLLWVDALAATSDMTSDIGAPGPAELLPGVDDDWVHEAPTGSSWPCREGPREWPGWSRSGPAGDSIRSRSSSWPGRTAIWRARRRPWSTGSAADLPCRPARGPSNGAWTGGPRW